MPVRMTIIRDRAPLDIVFEPFARIFGQAFNVYVALSRESFCHTAQFFRLIQSSTRSSVRSEVRLRPNSWKRTSLLYVHTSSVHKYLHFTSLNSHLVKIGAKRVYAVEQAYRHLIVPQNGVPKRIIIQKAETFRPIILDVGQKSLTM